MNNKNKLLQKYKEEGSHLALLWINDIPLVFNNRVLETGFHSVQALEEEHQHLEFYIRYGSDTDYEYWFSDKDPVRAISNFLIAMKTR